MNKETWIKHIREISGGIIPPSQGGNPADWHSALAMHKEQGFCQLCADRSKTRRANMARKERDQAMRDCGLVKVKGNLGGTYWE